jgi:hypothetical protein
MSLSSSLLPQRQDFLVRVAATGVAKVKGWKVGHSDVERLSAPNQLSPSSSYFWSFDLPLQLATLSRPIVLRTRSLPEHHCPFATLLFVRTAVSGIIPIRQLFSSATLFRIKISKTLLFGLVL